nr:nucleotidyl transferase AbiEii/AbiGii toxin family protein [Paraoerskovia marina]
MFVSLKGQIWRKVQVEIAPDEGGAGATPETIPAPRLEPFGLPTPDTLVTIAMRFQVAQKIHAASDPHDPPTSINDRPRDVVDLVLLRSLIEAEGQPTLNDIRTAAVAVCEARAQDARELGRPERSWPPLMSPHDHWVRDYAAAAHDAGLSMSLDEAVATVNEWIVQIESTK